MGQEEKRGRLEEALHSLDSAIEGVRSQASLAHLSEVLNVWEERLDVHAGPALKGVVRDDIIRGIHSTCGRTCHVWGRCKYQGRCASLGSLRSAAFRTLIDALKFMNAIHAIRQMFVIHCILIEDRG